MALCLRCANDTVVEAQFLADHYPARVAVPGAGTLELLGTPTVCAKCGLLSGEVSAYQLRNQLWESGDTSSRALVDAAGGPYQG